MVNAPCIMTFQKNQAELVLDITGFQIEYKEEPEGWEDAIRKDVPNSKYSKASIFNFYHDKLYMCRVFN